MSLPLVFLIGQRERSDTDECALCQKLNSFPAGSMMTKSDDVSSVSKVLKDTEDTGRCCFELITSATSAKCTARGHRPYTCSIRGVESWTDGLAHFNGVNISSVMTTTDPRLWQKSHQ